jgi:hypothetical protein
MRTTINLDEHLLKEAKRHAAETGRTLTGLIQDALRESLARRGPTSKRKEFRLRTFKGTGLQPGVDLDDSAALLDRMDRPSAAS